MKRLGVVLIGVVVLLTACSLAPGSRSSPTSAAPSMPTSIPTQAAPSGATPPPTRTAPLSTAHAVPPSNVGDAKMRQAIALLAAWDRHLELADSKSITFPQGLVAGGGWNGENANENKLAFMAGRIELANPLSADPPDPGSIEWSDGNSEAVPLITASEAFDRLLANVEGGVCDECAPLVVTGAHLAKVDAVTAKGDARVPAWEFEFQGDQQPIDPISVLAVWAANGQQGTDLGGATHDGSMLETAYGNAANSELTISFIGSPWSLPNPCGAEYIGEPVESGNAVAVIIRERGSGQSVACPAVGGYRTVAVTLASPLGDRTVLDVNYSMPVVLKNEPAPSFSPRP